MLYLYPSNKTETLAQLMAGIMGKFPLSDPFERELVLTQSYGMGVWLQQQISESLGISALVETKMPGAFIWDLIEKVSPQDHESASRIGSSVSAEVQRFEKDTLRWEIFRRLPGLIDRESFQSLKSYVDALTKQTGANDRRSALFEISCLIADLFDAYQNYRADWIQLWESGKSILDASAATPLAYDERWQRELWVELYPDCPLESRKHRSAQISALLSALNRDDLEVGDALPSRIFLFGMGAVPSQWLGLFVALARHTDVHLFLQNPSRYYWGDIVSERANLGQQARKISQGRLSAFSDVRDVEGNALLASWGDLGKSFLSELYEFDQSDGLRELDYSLYESSRPETALGWIQNDILDLQHSKTCLSIQDQSLRFARCHSRTREVEALRDHILGLLENDPELGPRDIIVMAPNIQDYSSMVQSVFGMPVATASGNEYRLPFGISDQSMLHDQPLLESLRQILTMDRMRISLPEVFELLAVPAIAQRFALSEEEIDVLTSLCLRLNIRWGLDESHRDRLSNASGTGKRNTWLEGFRRCLVAYLLGDLDAEEKQGYDLEPFTLHGRELHESLGKLVRLLDLIESTCSLQSNELTVSEWVNCFEQLFRDWFDLDNLDEAITLLLSRSIDALQSQAAITELEETLPFAIVSACVKEAFEGEKVSQRFLAGRINFCNLMPMRSIPFKIVCLLGMNDGDYPRLDSKQSFDLISRLPARRGDRSRRGDDRYMFLESLLSARNHFYVSYQGFDLKDNSERQPSVLVSELLEYCRKHMSGQGGKSSEDLLAAWTVSHRLQPFHPNYYIESDDRQTRGIEVTFNMDWSSLYGAAGLQTDSEQGQESEIEPVPGLSVEPSHPSHLSTERMDELTLDELVSCFSNPLAYYYQRILGVQLKGLPDTLPETEPFALYGLEAYSISQVLNEQWRSGADSDALYHSLERLGDLPREPYAHLELARLEKEQIVYRELLDQIGDVMTYSFSEVIAMAAGSTVLEGEFYISSVGQVEVRQSKSVDRFFFGAWFKHVLWNVVRSNAKLTDAPGSSVLITPKARIEFPALNPLRANHYLHELMQYFESACTAPKLFVPSQAFGLLVKPDASAQALFENAMTDPTLFSLWTRATRMRADVLGDIIARPEDDALFCQIKTHVRNDARSADLDTDADGNEEANRKVEEEIIVEMYK